uniref:Uncharacterized protein n=1 Tax=Panagrolaimus sp. PS1159 TaxID=55785 RepID=A0AC35EXL9_9BILA
SMLLDQGANMLYLSHEIPDLEFLQSLFVKIWQLVNASVGTDGFKDKNLYQSILRYIFPLFLMEHFADMLGINEVEADTIKGLLLNKHVINEDGEILINNKQQFVTVINSFPNIPQSSITRLIYAYDRVMNESRLDIPQHLHSYVKRHLKEFISNSKAALFMEEGVGYQVDIVRSD